MFGAPFMLCFAVTTRTPQLRFRIFSDLKSIMWPSSAASKGNTPVELDALLREHSEQPRTPVAPHYLLEGLYRLCRHVCPQHVLPQVVLHLQVKPGRTAKSASKCGRICIGDRFDKAHHLEAGVSHSTAGRSSSNEAGDCTHLTPTAAGTLCLRHDDHHLGRTNVPGCMHDAANLRAAS